MDPNHPVWKIVKRSEIVEAAHEDLQKFYDLLVGALNKMTEPERRLLYDGLDSMEFIAFDIIASTCGDIDGERLMDLYKRYDN